MNDVHQLIIIVNLGYRCKTWGPLIPAWLGSYVDCFLWYLNDTVKYNMHVTYINVEVHLNIDVVIHIGNRCKTCGFFNPFWYLIMKMKPW